MTNVNAVQGFVNLDKPQGLPSRKATNFVVRMFRGIPVGHAGTLDPLASGVLPVAVGGATRLVEALHDATKDYIARVRLGQTTDTDDSTGVPLGEPRPVDVTREGLESALAAFRGTIMQRPPQYSALKLGGRTAYKMARSGKALELEPRPVTFHELQLVSFDGAVCELHTSVSRGTYLRSLARDLGEALGCGAHLSGLIRTRVGAFTREKALTLPKLKELEDSGRAAETVTPLQQAFPEYAVLAPVDERTRRDVIDGKTIPIERYAPVGRAPAAGDLCFVQDATGLAFCLVECIAGEDGRLHTKPARRLV